MRELKIGHPNEAATQERTHLMSCRNFFDRNKTSECNMFNNATPF